MSCVLRCWTGKDSWGQLGTAEEDGTSKPALSSSLFIAEAAAALAAVAVAGKGAACYVFNFGVSGGLISFIYSVKNEFCSQSLNALIMSRH